MRVLHVADALSPIGGGSQQAILIWLKELVKQQVQTKLLCNDSFSLPTLSSEHLIKVPALPLGFILPKFSLSFFLNNKIKKQLRSFKPEVIHLHEPLPLAFLLMWWAKAHQIPVVVSYHTNFSYFYRKFSTTNFLFWAGKCLAYAQHYLLKRADLVTFPTRSSYQAYLKSWKLQSPVTFLPYPLNPIFVGSRQTTSQKNPITKLVTVSRLSREKKLDVLIKSLSHIQQPFHLTIIGEGNYRTQLQRMITDFHLDLRVILVGWLEPKSVAKILAESDVFLMASEFETFGIVYLEALVSGVPCVVADYEVTREVLPRGTVTFVKNNTVAEWSKVLSTLLNQPQKIEMMRQKIRESGSSFKKYYPENATKSLIRVYAQLLAKS